MTQPSKVMAFSEELAEIRANLDALRDRVVAEEDAAAKYVQSLRATREQIDRLVRGTDLEAHEGRH